MTDLEERKAREHGGEDEEKGLGCWRPVTAGLAMGEHPATSLPPVSPPSGIRLSAALSHPN